MKPLPITEDDLRANTTDKVYARGEEYCDDGMVLEVVRRGELLAAEVQGSEDEPYQVSVLFGKSGVREAGCTCPYMEEWSAWCKHIVATLLFCLRAPGDVENRRAPKKLLAALSQADLQDLLLTLAGRNPRLLAQMEDEAERLAAKRHL